MIMKRAYIQPESKYLTVNGEAVMIGGGDEEGYGSAMGNEATFEEPAPRNLFPNPHRCGNEEN